MSSSDLYISSFGRNDLFPDFAAIAPQQFSMANERYNAKSKIAKELQNIDPKKF